MDKFDSFGAGIGLIAGALMYLFAPNPWPGYSAMSVGLGFLIHGALKTGVFRKEERLSDAEKTEEMPEVIQERSPFEKPKTFEEIRPVLIAEGAELDKRIPLNLRDVELFRERIIAVLNERVGEYWAKEFSEAIDLKNLRYFPTMEGERHKSVGQMAAYLNKINMDDVRDNSRLMYHDKKKQDKEQFPRDS